MGSHALRERVFRANVALAGTGLVIETFGNVSGADHDAGLMAIKPSGVPYQKLTTMDMVLVSIETGEVVDSALRPSSDTPTHLELYRAFRCGAVVHTHSRLATAFAQAQTPIQCLNTTHADYFRGDVPVARPMTEAEVASDYERNTGLVIVETFRGRGLSPEEIGAVLVANHGPFIWADDPMLAVEAAHVLEYLAEVSLAARIINPAEPAPDRFLIDRHYLRKHGAQAYYGQKKPSS
ncbi:MAG: L-ribulose-5-phosphate 4-epimerase AraD [Vicinamibacterales bacterium]|jgi:L-ribulose-5-phosphate 4-epimerase|nr:L-ribulose-5-phosphate 4-epimerase AraD [Vicinamibacterales bacterium]